MSTLTALARVQAVAAGRAQPIATVRHVHIHQRPLVVVPLALAGEANAPLAAMVGEDRAATHLLVVAQPRNRDQRFAFAATLAHHVMSYVDGFAGSTQPVPIDRGRDSRLRFTDAPQIVVPNVGGIGFLRLFGRSIRFRRTDGDYPVDPAVPILGRWLTFFADPTFDNEILAPLIESGNLAGLDKALATQLAPTWALMWGAPGMSVGHPGRMLGRSWGSWRVIGPQVSMTRARAASALWKPRARLMMRRTTLLRPSARPLLIPSRIAARMPSRCLRMVLATLTNAGSRDRLAREIHRSISSATPSGSRSPAKMARKASLRV